MNKLIQLSTRFVPLLAALTLAIFGDAHATNWQVSMGADDRFHPDSLTVALGDSITWTNDDADDHTSTSGAGCTPDGDWDSGTVGPGETFTYVTDDPGTHPYHCVFHCDMGMVGVIVVTEPTSTEQSTWGRIKSLYGD